MEVCLIFNGPYQGQCVGLILILLYTKFEQFVSQNTINKLTTETLSHKMYANKNL